MVYLRADDPLEAHLMVEITRRRIELAGLERQDQAVRIANAVAEMLNGG